MDNFLKRQFGFSTMIYCVVGCLVGAALLFCSSPLVAEVDQQESDLRYIATVSQALTNDPGGRKIGDLYVNAPVKVIEVRGDWSRVSVEGWVRNNSLSSPGRKVNAKDATTINETGFVLDSFTIRQARESGQQPRVYLNLKIKNNTGKPVYRWSGDLVAKDLDGKVLFSEYIADDKANVNYGATRSVSFYWESNENPFEPLRAAENREGTIKLELLKLKLVSD